MNDNKVSRSRTTRHKTCLSEKTRRTIPNTLACLPDQVNVGRLSQTSSKKATVNIKLKNERCTQSAHSSTRKRILKIKGVSEHDTKDRFNEDTVTETSSIRKTMVSKNMIISNLLASNGSLPKLSEKSRTSTIMGSQSSIRTKSSRVTSLLSRKSVKSYKRSASAV